MFGVVWLDQCRALSVVVFRELCIVRMIQCGDLKTEHLVRRESVPELMKELVKRSRGGKTVFVHVGGAMDISNGLHRS